MALCNILAFIISTSQICFVSSDMDPQTTKKKKKEKSIDRAFMRKHITIFTLLHAVRHSKETYHNLN